MLAFLFCARSHPDKTEVIWADSAGIAISVACKTLHLPALHVELERAAELDGLSECPQGSLDNYRVFMMDKFPMPKVAEGGIPDEDEYKVVEPTRYQPRAPAAGLDDEWGEPFSEEDFKPVVEKRPAPSRHHTPKPVVLKGLKKDTPDLSGPKERSKKKPKPRDSFKDGDRDEWGRKG